MARIEYDHCAECGESFLVQQDEDGFPCSERDELTCECGNVTCCQRCREEHEACAECGKILCHECGGNSLDGDAFCSEHMPKPEIKKAAA